jgi:hypothetical protein
MSVKQPPRNTHAPSLAVVAPPPAFVPAADAADVYKVKDVARRLFYAYTVNTDASVKKMVGQERKRHIYCLWASLTESAKHKFITGLMRNPEIDISDKAILQQHSLIADVVPKKDNSFFNGRFILLTYHLDAWILTSKTDMTKLKDLKVPSETCGLPACTCAILP